MRIAMKRKSCLTMTPSFCCSLLPNAVCHFVLQSDVMEGTLARDRDHKEERISETTCRFRAGFSSIATLGCVGFAIVVRPRSMSAQLTKPHSQEWLCYSKLYLLGDVCVLSITFS
jgi:hypothetical protein